MVPSLPTGPFLDTWECVSWLDTIYGVAGFTRSTKWLSGGDEPGMARLSYATVLIGGGSLVLKRATSVAA